MSAQRTLTREMVLMTASLAMAAAREKKVVPPFLDEARLILVNFPGCGIDETELAAEMERAFVAGLPADPPN